MTTERDCVDDADMESGIASDSSSNPRAGQVYEVEGSLIKTDIILINSPEAYYPTFLEILKYLARASLNIDILSLCLSRFYSPVRIIGDLP